MFKIPKGSLFRRILTLSVLQTIVSVISICCVISFMVQNDLSKGRWAFDIFASCLSLLYAVSITMLYLKDIPRRHLTFNWSVMFAGSVQAAWSRWGGGLWYLIQVKIKNQVVSPPRDNYTFTPNWCQQLTATAIIIAFLLFISAIAIAVHIERSCLEHCALATVASISSFFLTFLFLLEALYIFLKTREEKSRKEEAVINNMESAQTAQTQL